MITSPNNLESHIKLIHRVGAVPVHLHDWISRSRQGKPLPRLAVAITFDDGWKDNYQHAFPLLRKHGIPFTIFLVSQLIDSHETFWPEHVLKLLRSTSLPSGDNSLSWLISYLPPPTRENFRGPLNLTDADEVINKLKAMDDADIIKRLNDFYRAHPGFRPLPTTRSLLNAVELEEMASSDLVRYGAHTRHHFRLNRLKNRQTLKQEIIGSLEEIKVLSEKSVEIFCYPNGDTTKDAIELISRNFNGACTTKTGWNYGDCDPYYLKRFSLHDGNSSSRFRVLATIGRGFL